MPELRPSGTGSSITVSAHTDFPLLGGHKPDASLAWSHPQEGPIEPVDYYGFAGVLTQSPAGDDPGSSPAGSAIRPRSGDRPQARAFCLIWSNSAWVMAPLSRSPFALAICSDGSV